MASLTKQLLNSLYQSSFDYFGPLHWWPGETPFEVMVGAILTQNTSWSNVEKAIANLKRAQVLTPEKLLALPPEKLAELIKPAGFFRLKTKRLLSFVNYFVDQYNAQISRMQEVPLDILRKELLAVHGIGPETADSILLYALEKPIFVVDAYTRRILHRHHLCAEDDGYAELQAIFMDHLQEDAAHFNEFHAQIVNIGKDFCRTRPRCEECPLNGLNWQK